MELAEKVRLLDDLLSLNELARVPEPQVANLVQFLSELGNAEREAFLIFIHQGDHFNRFENLAKLASMEKAQRNQFLKALNIGIESGNMSPQRLLEFSKGYLDTATAALSSLAEARQLVDDKILRPWRQLFSLHPNLKKTRSGG